MVRVLFLEYLPGRLANVKDVFLQIDPELDHDVRIIQNYELTSAEIVVYDIIVFDCHILPESAFSQHGLSLLKEKCVLVAISNDELLSFEKLNFSKYSIDNYLIHGLPHLLEATIKRELELFAHRDEIDVRKQTELLLNAITDITSSLLEVNNLEEISRLVIHKIIKHFSFEDCVIYELNKEKKTLTQVAAQGPKEDGFNHVINPLTLKIGQGIVGHVAQTGKPVLLNDVTEDYRYVVDDAERNSELSVPIFLNGQVIGVIDSEHFEKNFYTQNDLQNLEAVASVIAIKFHAAQLRNEKDDVQKELQKSLDEKIVLLSEVHHRVKNNLAIISGLLHLQTQESVDSKLNQILLEMSNRIQSIAGVHELLYNSESFADITFDDYVSNLLATISFTFENHEKVALNLEIDHKLKININQAVPLGLILNELVTNSFKYAFVGIEKPSIFFSMHLKDGKISGMYSDNGPGFSSNFLTNPTSLGFTVITALLTQLDAEIDYDNDKVYPLNYSFQI